MLYVDGLKSAKKFLHDSTNLLVCLIVSLLLGPADQHWLLGILDGDVVLLLVIHEGLHNWALELLMTSAFLSYSAASASFLCLFPS